MSAIGELIVLIIYAMLCVPLELLEPPPLSLTVEQTEPTCHSDTNGLIILNATGGSPSSTGDHNFSLGSEITTNNSTFTGLVAGSYDFGIEDGQQCFIDTTIQLLEPKPIAIAMPEETNLEWDCFLNLNAQIISELDYEIQWLPIAAIDCPNCNTPCACFTFP